MDSTADLLGLAALADGAEHQGSSAGEFVLEPCVQTCWQLIPTNIPKGGDDRLAKPKMGRPTDEGVLVKVSFLFQGLPAKPSIILYCHPPPILR